MMFYPKMGNWESGVRRDLYVCMWCWNYFNWHLTSAVTWLWFLKICLWKIWWHFLTMKRGQEIEEISIFLAVFRTVRRKCSDDKQYTTPAQFQRGWIAWAASQAIRILCMLPLCTWRPQTSSGTVTVSTSLSWGQDTDEMLRLHLTTSKRLPL